MLSSSLPRAALAVLVPLCWLSAAAADTALMGTAFDPAASAAVYPGFANGSHEFRNAAGEVARREVVADDVVRGVPCRRITATEGDSTDISWIARDTAGRIIEIQYDEDAAGASEAVQPASVAESWHYALGTPVGATWSAEDGEVTFTMLAKDATAPRNGATDCYRIGVAGEYGTYAIYLSAANGPVEYSEADQDTPVTAADNTAIAP